MPTHLLALRRLPACPPVSLTRALHTTVSLTGQKDDSTAQTSGKTDDAPKALGSNDTGHASIQKTSHGRLRQPTDVDQRPRVGMETDGQLRQRDNESRTPDFSLNHLKKNAPRTHSAPSIPNRVSTSPKAEPQNTVDIGRPAGTRESWRYIKPDFSKDRRGPLSLLGELFPSRKPRGALSLLGELFPKTDRREPMLEQPKKAQREVPRFKLGVARELEPDQRLGENEERKSLMKRGRQAPGRVVLKIAPASLHLDVSDFRRLLPPGRHIEGWNPGSFERIIACRNQATMRRNGEYLLVFRTVAAANAYLHSVNGHWEKSKQFNAPGIPPPPDISEDGTTIVDPRAKYSLSPASHRPSFRIFSQPLTPHLNRLVHEGYQLFTANAQSQHEVFLFFDKGYMPPSYTLREYLIRDGDERQAPWTTVGPNGGIRCFDINDLDENNHIGAAQTRGISPWVEKLSKRYKRCYIISFADERSARRFVLEWHRKDVSSLMEPWMLDDIEAPIANAEYL